MATYTFTSTNPNNFGECVSAQSDVQAGNFPAEANFTADNGDVAVLIINPPAQSGS